MLLVFVTSIFITHRVVALRNADGQPFLPSVRGGEWVSSRVGLRVELLAPGPWLSLMKEPDSWQTTVWMIGATKLALGTGMYFVLWPLATLLRRGSWSRGSLAYLTSAYLGHGFIWTESSPGCLCLFCTPFRTETPGDVVSLFTETSLAFLGHISLRLFRGVHVCVPSFRLIGSL